MRHEVAVQVVVFTQFGQIVCIAVSVISEEGLEYREAGIARVPAAINDLCIWQHQFNHTDKTKIVRHFIGYKSRSDRVRL